MSVSSLTLGNLSSEQSFDWLKFVIGRALRKDSCMASGPTTSLDFRDQISMLA
jgi:hypothetical protein